MIDKIVDFELLDEEILYSNIHFIDFIEEIKKYLEKSSRFDDIHSYQGSITSKRKFHYQEKNIETPFIEINFNTNSKEGLKYPDDAKFFWNSFNITFWHIKTEKITKGIIFKKEHYIITQIEEYNITPFAILDKRIPMNYAIRKMWNGKGESPKNYLSLYEIRYFMKLVKDKTINIDNEELLIINKIFKCGINIISKIKKENSDRISKLNHNQNLLINEIDKNGDGQVDFIDVKTFDNLLSKNQKNILKIDDKYIQKFVKISIYLNTKKNNTQKIFESIKNTHNEIDLNELVNLLKNQIHTFDLLVFHSINMLTSLVEDDRITFFEIYECFDQLGVFNSNWENEVSDKLTDIGSGINELMHSIYNMENKIVSSIDNLTYVTKDSFRELSDSVEKQLTNIDSTIKFNNFLNVIQTYQMYKINKNTKRLS